MRIGIIAPEFPPSLGGMQVMALNLALELSKRHQVTAFTRRNQTPSPSSFKTTPLLEADVDRDAAGLGSANVDVWLAMNAGYSVLVGPWRSRWPSTATAMIFSRRG